MPLSGAEKKAYQKEYMRRKRLGLTSGSNKGLTKILDDKVEKTADLNSEIWWSRWDSNPLPLECKSSVLPSELRPHVDSYLSNLPKTTPYSKSSNPLLQGKGIIKYGVMADKEGKNPE
jgi:hypothetical protein